jgi:hypothetical protein
MVSSFLQLSGLRRVGHLSPAIQHSLIPTPALPRKREREQSAGADDDTCTVDGATSALECAAIRR